jgi:anti-sigma regulatory factor (Ser/Thr protein kinase)
MGDVVEGTGARSVTLPAELRSVAKARHFVAETVSGWLDDPSDVLLMTSELVANVVRHAETEVAVSVRRGPPVRVEVHDGVAATEAFRELIGTGVAMPDPSSPGGRGLALVRALSSRIGLDDDPAGGKVVWFEC